MRTDELQNQDQFDTPHTACPLCGSHDISFHYRIDHQSPSFTVDRCHDCGFIFMNPPFKDETIQQFYGREYYEGTADYTYYDERSAERFARFVWDARLKTIRRYVPGGSILDIGCSFGGFLSAASRWFVPHGIEISPFAAEYARKRLGNTIHRGTIGDHPYNHHSFDVITMVEVIEHMKDPAFLVEECRQLLRPGGLLLIQTANMEGLQAQKEGSEYGYYLPGHLSYFSKRNLTTTLKQHGFSRVKAFHPVDFGLLPKLQKSRMNFNSITDYLQWLRITGYHYRGKIRGGNFALTSSMVLYAFA